MSASISAETCRQQDTMNDSPPPEQEISSGDTAPDARLENYRQVPTHPAGRLREEDYPGKSLTPVYCIYSDDVIVMEMRYSYRKLNPSQFRVFHLCSQSMEQKLRDFHDAGRLLLERMMPDIHGVGFRGDIFGYLIDTTLANNTQYDCLSYTWGTGPYEYSIRMGDHRVCIPRNLYRALRCLQLKDEPRLVWVDFFCINQEDAEERQTQVEMMYQIYQGAREVVVDLGDASDGSENLPGLFKDIIVATAEEYGFLAKPQTPNALAGRTRLPPITSDIWHAFKSFLERPWFTRVWIIQEVIAAKKFIVICGDWTIAGGTLFTVLEVAIEWQLPCCPTHSESRLAWENDATVSLRQICLMLHLGIGEKEGFRSRHGLSDRPDKHRLIGLLERSRHARSTDPRDRAFAFLNLCREQERQSLRPDYTETVAETYTRIARFFVSQGEASRLLCNAFLSDSTLQLPTWIPDWSLSNIPFENIAPEINLLTDMDEQWPCAGGKEGEFSLSDTCDILQVQAYRIGQISCLSQVRRYCKDPPPEASDDDLELVNNTRNPGSPHTQEENQDRPCRSPHLQPTDTPIEQFHSSIRFEEGDSTQRIDDKLQQWPILWRCLEQITAHVMESTAYPDEDKKDVIWRTMTCERKVGTNSRAPPEYYQDWKTYCEITRMGYLPGQLTERVKELTWPLPDDTEMTKRIQCPKYCAEGIRRDAELMWEQYERFGRAARRFCFQLRESMTSTGIVSMVPHRTEVGDFIVVIKGVCVPMVLREVNEFDGRFQVVGQAYCHGFMNGEILQRSEAEFKFNTIFLV